LKNKGILLNPRAKCGFSSTSEFLRFWLPDLQSSGLTLCKMLLNKGEFSKVVGPAGLTLSS
jgi:hypothetical protein